MVNTPDGRGVTPLQYALPCGTAHLMSDCDEDDKSGEFEEEEELRRAQDECIRFLLRHGADTTQVSCYYQQYFLEIAETDDSATDQSSASQIDGGRSGGGEGGDRQRASEDLGVT